MSRSTGVTVSAIVVIIGSVFTILGSAILLLSSLFLSKTPPIANAPRNLGILVAVEALVIFAFGAWGLAAGIGLLNLKQWARISLLVYASFLVVISLPAAVLLAFLPFPNTPAATDPNLPSNFMSIMRTGLVLFYLAFAALGVFWLYFFNKRTIKMQFQTKSVSSSSLPFSAGIPIGSLPSKQSARPLSVSIIGWFLLASSAFAPIALLLNLALFHGMRFPIFFLGFFLFGSSAILVLVLWMATQAGAAVGLLKLKTWGLFATIALQCLALVNTVILLFVPSNRVKFQQFMNSMMVSMNPRMPIPTSFVFPMWIGLAFSFAFVLVILCFLFKEKDAFTSTGQEPTEQPS